VVFVTTFERFSRNSGYCQSFLHNHPNVRVYSCIDEVMTGRSLTYFVFRNAVSAGQLESARLGDKIKASVALRREAGTYGPAPYGTERIIEDGIVRYVDAEIEQNVRCFVRYIRNCENYPLSLTTLCNHLETIGIENPVEQDERRDCMIPLHSFAVIYTYSSLDRCTPRLDVEKVSTIQEVANFLNFHVIKYHKRKWTARSVKEVLD
jgi:hypothetical protein